MSVPKIRDLEKLLSQYIEKNKKIVKTKISRLTAPGENYGSEMLKVDVVLKDEETNKEEDLNVVAKLIPISEFFQTVFNIQVSFKIEKEFYNTIVPTLQQFQRKQGVTKTIDFFPKFYGARDNLENDTGVVDENAVLILENLKTKGYINVDRFDGFDFHTTKLLLRDLAQFHAVPLALKLKDPRTFDEKVKVYMACFNPVGAPPPTDDADSYLLAQLEGKEAIKHLLPILAASLKLFGRFSTTFREPFATIVHGDLWVNNIMVRLEDDKAVDSKIVDFQKYTYDSPAADLLFFLWTSVAATTLQAHFDDFIKYYHSVFVETLESLKCDTAPFSYDLFLDEVAASVNTALGQSVFMLAFVVHLKKGGLPGEDDPSTVPKFGEAKIEQRTKDVIWWILEECERRGWPRL